MGERTDCDVLVAGSGAGGFAAALTAAHHGLNVVLAEKSPVVRVAGRGVLAIEDRHLHAPSTVK